VSSAPLLFVYGTLKRSFPKNRHSSYLSREADFIGNALILGRLYGLKRYPGLRPALPGEDQWVAGEVFRLRRPETTLARLDAYEADEYRRVRRLVLLEDGREVPCWVYVFWQTLPRHRRVMDGVWENRES
jgi:gamma-glutamylcyclotransferase (GGCT)/AIG2-like uncharacterized protein YtfP